MSVLNRLQQLAATGVALTSFAEASNYTIDNIPPAAQSYASMDAKTLAIELYKRFNEADITTPKLSEEARAQIAHTFIQENNISDKNVYDMMLNYNKYITEYTKANGNKKVSDNTLQQDTQALYFAFTQTDFYKTKRDTFIKRWIPMAEAVSEGYYHHGYLCTAGEPTIGIGTCLTTSGLSLNDIPIRKLQRNKKGGILYVNGNPVPGRELTLAEKERFRDALKNLGSTSYEKGADLTKNMGIYGLTHDDARKIATLECQKKMDQILKFAFLDRKVDMFQEPIALGVLALDIHYQCGALTNPNKWPNFWACVCEKRYKDLKGQVKVNGGKNVNRHKVKEALCDHIAAEHTYKTAISPTQKGRAWMDRNLAYNKIREHNIDIYGLKRREVQGAPYHTSGMGMAKAVPAKGPVLKQRTVTPEQRAEFEKVKQMLSPQSVTNKTVSSVNNAPYIKTPPEKLEELQNKTEALPESKRAKSMSAQELTNLAKRHNVNAQNLIHLTTRGCVDINVCLDYLKKETQKRNRAKMQQKRQGR